MFNLFQFIHFSAASYFGNPLHTNIRHTYNNTPNRRTNIFKESNDLGYMFPIYFIPNDDEKLLLYKFCRDNEGFLFNLIEEFKNFQSKNTEDPFYIEIPIFIKTFFEENYQIWQRIINSNQDIEHIVDHPEYPKCYQDKLLIAKMFVVLDYYAENFLKEPLELKYNSTGTFRIKK